MDAMNYPFAGVLSWGKRFGSRNPQAKSLTNKAPTIRVEPEEALRCRVANLECRVQGLGGM